MFSYKQTDCSCDDDDDDVQPYNNSIIRIPF